MHISHIMDTPESMNIGSTVMFSNMESRYAKWFFGEFGTVLRMRNGHVRVQWSRPIRYHDGFSTLSDFCQTSFTFVV